MRSQFARFLAEDSGTALTEYALLLAFVMFMIVALANGFKASVTGVTTVTNANLSAASGISGQPEARDLRRAR
jgi:Flp pilus assembly pilin Flp